MPASPPVRVRPETLTFLPAPTPAVANAPLAVPVNDTVSAPTTPERAAVPVRVAGTVPE